MGGYGCGCGFGCVVFWVGLRGECVSGCLRGECFVYFILGVGEIGKRGVGVRG